jgi:hypothetical protein
MVIDGEPIPALDLAGLLTTKRALHDGTDQKVRTIRLGETVAAAAHGGLLWLPVDPHSIANPEHATVDTERPTQG